MRLLAGDAPGQTPPVKPDSSVAELQRTLKAYSQLVSYAPADPGPADGIVGPKTAIAVLMVIPRINQLPAEVRTLAALGPLALSNDDLRKQVYKTITSYAGAISTAIIAAQAYQAVTGGGPAIPPTSGGGGKSQYATIPGNFITAVTGWQATPGGGGAVPANPTSTIFFWDFWTQRYRVAIPRGAGLGASSYVDYVEVAPAKSRPAMGTEVNRNTFMNATGKWWGTTGGMIGIAVGVLAAGGAVYAGVQAVRR